MIDARIKTEKDNNGRYRLLGLIRDETYSELMKTLYFMKEHEIPIGINTEDRADVDCEEYYINEISLIAPEVGGNVFPYIEIYTKNCMFIED